MRLPNKASNPIGARWDKLKSWKTLRDDIEDKLQTADNLEEAITLDIGPQLLHTIRHPSSLRCTDHTSSKLGEMFTTHYNKGAVQSVKIWTLESKDKNGVCKNVGFETECEITSMAYVSKHRVYLVFCMDLTLRVFTISNNNFVEVQSVPRLDTILCLIYNKEDDEIYAGGIGFLEEWRVQGAEHAASVIPGRKFVTDLTRNEWIRDIQIDRHNNQMYAMHGAGICVVNFKTRKEMHKVPNKHEGPMKCCCYYPQSDCLVTGGADGRIKLFNSTVFNLLHVFMGHHGPVTGLVPHKKDSLLFSCSHDGTVRIWRMDSLQMFMRLDIGEKIMNLSLLGDSEFYFLTDKNILIYSLNQFYEIFAPVESETKKLICSRGKGKPNKILGSTEDGSVRLFSPVTGLTLTIIYPMPSFQVLSSFAYDIHQDRLHTVLFEGKVLVYNTATNPCTADEVWLPSCEDEEVHNLLLVTVEFMCDDGVTDMDNLVFAGLKNGQIILCEAVVCSLDAPIQAHEGALTCLESCLHMAEGSGATVGLLETCGVIISGGTDNFVKVWTINITTESHRPIVTLSQIIKIYLPSFPSHVCMFSNLLSVCIQSTTSLGVRWRVVMFHLLPESHQRRSIWFNLDRNMSVMPLQVNHPPDEDHTLQLTALDKCPIMRIVLSAGKDGYVKIWSSQNELLREMNFATPLFASCFANDRGDILVGYGTHLCSVSVINYLPVEYLRQVADFACIKLEDDVRELPVKFDHQCEPWLDLNKLRKYSIDILERRRQHLEIEIIERLKRATEKEAETKFVIFVDGGKTKVIRKDFADRLLNWAKGKNKLNFGAFKKCADLSSLTEDDSGNQINIKKSLEGKTKGSRSNGAKLVKSGAIQASTKPEYLDSAGTIEIYPSTVGKALRQLGTQKPCSPLEMRLIQERELLKKDPIIAPDGYIPNSVIRKKLKPPQVDTVFRRVEKPFKLKPVPKVNPDHLPSWWGKEDEEKNTATPRRGNLYSWDDTPSQSPRSDTSFVSSVSLESFIEIESPVKRYIDEGKNSKTPGGKLSKTPKNDSKTPKAGSKTPRASKSSNSPEENIKKLVKLNNKYAKNIKKSGWEDSSVSERPDTLRSQGQSGPTSAVSDARRSPTKGSDMSPMKLPKHKPSTPSTPYQSGSVKSRPSSTDSVKSKRMDLTRIDLDMGTPDSRRGRKSGRQSVERSRSFKLTNLAVDEDSSMIHVKDSKSGRRGKPSVSCEIIQKLMTEDWMPELKEDCEYEDVLDGLNTVLDNPDTADNPVLYDTVCNYVTTIFTDLGIPDQQLTQTIEKLGTNLNHTNTAIKKYTMKTLQVLGQGRNDVILLILPKLVDPDEPIRKAAAEAIQTLTGAQDKDTLLKILDELGITGGVYNSKGDEEYALSVLAERFAERSEDPQYFDRIQDWVAGTTPGLYDMFEEDGDNDPVWQEGQRSRKSSMNQKERSFLSDGGKSVFDVINYDTSGGNTMYADLPMTPGSFSDGSDIMNYSRGVSRYDAKSTGLKSEKSRFNARMDLMDRGGASIVPSERWEPPTTDSDNGMDQNDQFIEGQESPFSKEGVTTEKSNLTAKTNLENMLLKERTLTDLSQVGPLPKFIHNDIGGHNFDAISTDSAFESAMSTSEYAQSHFSEKNTVSHLDHHSSKHSQLSSEDNNMFDVEQVSNLDFEGEFDDCSNSMKKHELSMSLKYDNSMISELSDDVMPREITVEITPRDILVNLGRKDRLQTPRSKRTETGSTVRHKLQDIDGYSTISDRSVSSRKSQRSMGSSKDGDNNAIVDLDPITGQGQDYDGDVEEEPLSELVVHMSIQIRDILDYQTTERLKKPARQDPEVAVDTERSDNDLDPDRQNLPVYPLDVYSSEITTTSQSKSDNQPDTLPLPSEIIASRQASPVVTMETDPQQSVAMETTSPTIATPTQVVLEESTLVAIESPRTPMVSEETTLTADTHTIDARFTPKDPHLYKYYDKKSQDGDSMGLPEEDEARDKIEERDSDIHTISNTTSSQITERLSNQDSGIGRDMSGYTSSHTRSYARGGYRHGGPLSPVKSEECSPLPQLHRQQSPQDWRKFFELPNAVERRQMEQIKREMEQGKLKPSTLPPISYFAEDLPMLPGEAGTRLLQTVRVNDKVPINKDGKHRIESVPGKLAVHTQNEVGGLSNFGILQMQWTTGVPTVKDRTAPPQRIPQYRSHGHTQESYYIPAHHDDRLRGDLSEEELNLPHLASGSPRVTGDGSSHYEWDFPLPPPPAKESRTNVPSIKRQHDNYCKYYQLVKKKLHLYTSPFGFIPAVIAAEKFRPKQTRESSLHLPEVYVKQIRERQRTQKSFGSPPLKNRRSPSKSNLGASVLFPPIKLGQLIKIW